MNDQAVRRQERGRQRMSAILDAAVVVFARDGVERATTNAIAREAGVSPGSLYQFYRDKEDLLVALGRRYADELTATYRRSLDSVPLDTVAVVDLLDTVLDPIVEFKNEHAAFVPLFARTDLPASVIGPVAEVDALFSDTMTALLIRRNPGADPAAVRTAALIMINLFRGMVAGLGAATGDQAGDLAEVKTVLLGYLDRKGLH